VNSRKTDDPFSPEMCRKVKEIKINTKLDLIHQYHSVQRIAKVANT
jgi:hypothetical protein